MSLDIIHLVGDAFYVSCSAWFGALMKTEQTCWLFISFWSEVALDKPTEFNQFSELHKKVLMQSNVSISLKHVLTSAARSSLVLIKSWPSCVDQRSACRRNIANGAFLCICETLDLGCWGALRYPSSSLTCAKLDFSGWSFSHMKIFFSFFLL